MMPETANSSTSGGSASAPVQMVVGSPPSATATSSRSSPRRSPERKCLAPTLWLCQCMPAVTRS